MSEDTGKSGIYGQTLPGTGGDIAPTDSDQDVEGHLKHSPMAPDDAARDVAPEPDEALRPATPEPDEKDVEGHLFRTGPTTEGEFSRRGPGDNPHGDR